MTSDDFNSAFSTVESARDWLRTALLGWQESKNARAYSPFLGYFSPQKEPWQILVSIYQDTPNSRIGLLKSPPRSQLRQALAGLICDPEVVRWHPLAHIELIRFAGAVGANEVLKSLSEAMRAGLLRNNPDLGRAAKASYNILSTAFQTVSQAGFSGPLMVSFLGSCKEQLYEGGLDPLAVLTQLSVHDPDHWVDHVVDVQQELYEFGATRLGQRGSRETFRAFRDRMIRYLGLERYEKALQGLADHGQLARISWLVPEGISIDRRSPEPKLQSTGGLFAAIAAMLPSKKGTTLETLLGPRPTSVG